MWRNGRRNGLKIRWTERSVRVRVPPSADRYKFQVIGCRLAAAAEDSVGPNLLLLSFLAGRQEPRGMRQVEDFK
jgi:hypothetical protein